MQVAKTHHPVSARIQRLRQKQTLLRNILKEKIAVAHVLQDTPAKTEKEIAYAWDVVEEISQKIHRIQQIIEDNLYTEEDQYVYQEELGQRIYDI